MKVESRAGVTTATATTTTTTTTTTIQQVNKREVMVPPLPTWVGVGVCLFGGGRMARKGEMPRFFFHLFLVHVTISVISTSNHWTNEWPSCLSVLFLFFLSAHTLRLFKSIPRTTSHTSSHNIIREETKEEADTFSSIPSQ